VITLKSYDILGREDSTFVNDSQEAGVHKIAWNAADFPTGIYFYSIVAGNFIQTRKMVLMQ
jgi:hypothetical protein